MTARLRTRVVGTQLRDHVPHEGRTDDPLLARISRQQGPMRRDVDQARNAARVSVQQTQRPGGKDVRRAGTAGNAQAMRDVAGRLGTIERLEVPTYGDALVQLRELGTTEKQLQLRLADEH